MELVKEIKGWQAIRDFVISGKLDLSENILSNYSKEALDIIRNDLYWCWVETPYKLNTFDTLKEKMEKESKYARVEDFAVFRKVTHLSLKREDAQAVGSKFADKWGKVFQWAFKDENGLEKIFTTTSYSFGIDFKSSGVKSGEKVIVKALSFPDPELAEKVYRRWIFQKEIKPKQIEYGDSAVI